MRIDEDCSEALEQVQAATFDVKLISDIKLYQTGAVSGIGQKQKDIK